MSTATSTSPLCRCRRSTPLSSPGCCRGCPAIPSRCRRFINPRWPPARSCTPQTIPIASSTGWVPAPPRPFWDSARCRPCWTVIWPIPDTRPSRPISSSGPTGRTTCGNRSMTPRPRPRRPRSFRRPGAPSFPAAVAGRRSVAGAGGRSRCGSHCRRRPVDQGSPVTSPGSTLSHLTDSQPSSREEPNV